MKTPIHKRLLMSGIVLISLAILTGIASAQSTEWDEDYGSTPGVAFDSAAGWHTYDYGVYYSGETITIQIVKNPDYEGSALFDITTEDGTSLINGPLGTASTTIYRVTAPSVLKPTQLLIKSGSLTSFRDTDGCIVEPKPTVPEFGTILQPIAAIFLMTGIYSLRKK